MRKRIAIFNDTSPSMHYGCCAVMSNICSIAQEADLDAKFFFPYNIDWRPHGERLKLILKRFDVILVNGEGSIHNSSENKRAEYLLELPSLAKEIGVPIYLINATIHKMSDDAYLAIKKFNAIFVRESESKKILEKKDIKSTIIPDFSFFSEPLGKPKEISKKNRILFTGSTIKKTHKELALLSHRSHSDFKDILFYRNRKIFKLLEKISKKVIYFPEREYVKYNNKHYDWIERIQNYQGVVTGRFHAVTLCLVARTPFIAVESNTPKISRVLYDIFGNNDRVWTIDELLKKEIGIGQSLMNLNETDFFAISKYIEDGRETALKAFESL